MQNQTIVLIVLSGIIALAIALFQYVYKLKKRSKIYWLLTVLRFFTIFAILLLLINPKFENITYFNEKPNLIVAVDNSESVAYLNQAENVKQLISKLKNDQDLSQNFNLQFFSFGKEINELDSLTFSDNQTNMANALGRFKEVYNTTVSPIVLITDGNQTYGNDFTYLAKSLKQPIFPIILGDTTSFTDLRISQLNVNRYAYLKNKFPVEVIINYEGKQEVNSKLNVTAGNSVLYSTPLKFSENNSSQIVNLTLLASRVGIRSLKAEIIPLENEKNLVNNIKNFAVEVIDQKTNVAIVSDIIHPDLGALKKSIESNEQRQSKILSTAEYLSEPNNFQLVILYQPNNKFKAVFEEINRLKLNKFVIAGTETNWSLLNNLQNNFTQQVTNQREEFQPVLNLNYSPFIIEGLAFDEFAPLSTEFGETNFNLPFETVLFKTINGTQLEEPLLATFEINSNREAVLLGEGIWRWRAQSFLDAGNFENFDNFMGKLIQYLSANQRRTRINVDYETFYNGNDNIIITAQFFNKNYEFDANQSLIISLKNKETQELNEFPFVLADNNYQVDLSGITAGDYEFKINVIGQNISKSAALKILDYNVEQQFLNANVEKLRNAANSSNGEIYFISDTGGLVNNLTNDSRFATVQKSSKKVVPLIDFKYLLAFMAICLSAEWFIRKYNGLI